MSSGSHLGNTPLNLAKLRDVTRKKLPDILDKVQGKKGLVLDPSLTGPLSLMAEFTLLKDHGVEKIYHLDETLQTDCTDVIYLCRPKMRFMRYIAEHIRHRQQLGQRFNCWLFMVPKRTLICERVLEEEGVRGDVTVGDYALDWVPYDDDLISMELEPGTWKDIYLDGDYTPIYYAARALMRLQSIYGLFPSILGKGDGAKHLADLLERMRHEQAVNRDATTATLKRPPSLLNTVSNHIDQLVIIDRNADTITPLCIELTYEGLIDEVMGIKHGFVELDANLVTPANPTSATSPPSGPSSSPAHAAGKKKKYVLNASDKLFGQLRDQNFVVIGGILNRIAKRINENYEERHLAKTVAQIRDFVGRLGELQLEHQSLRIHTDIAERIQEYTITDDFHKMLEVQQDVLAGSDGTREQDYIEDMIGRQKPLIQVLRLLCLVSQAKGGLRPRVYDHFEREIVQTYGYEHIETLHRLERLGLLNRHTSQARTTFATSRRALRLIVADVDERNPNDISYVYSGYAPLSVRLVQCTMQKWRGPSLNLGSGASSFFPFVSNQPPSTSSPRSDAPNGSSSGSWRGYEDLLKHLPGKLFEIKQTVDNEPEVNAALSRAKRHAQGQQKTTLIFFLGGCTHTEVSAVRFLAQQDENRHYLVATTQIINSTSFLEPLLATSARRATHDGIGRA